MKISWNKDALENRKERLKKAQTYVDTQCAIKMTPYVPVGLPKYKNSGKLRDSVKITSPGRISYTARFAKSDYYAPVSKKDHRNGGNPQAQRLWFEVMKKQHGGAILRGAARIAGGKTK